MDKLGLTNAFLIETGADDVTAALEGAGDDITQAAHWIVTSWESFQRDRQWPFRRAEGSINVVNGQTSYDWDSLSLEDGDIILPHSFYNSSGSIEQLQYYPLRALRRAGGSVDDSRVSKVAVRSGYLETYPDVATTQALEFDYLKGVQTLVEDTDVPYGLPSDFHMLIVHRAVSKYGALIGGAEGANLYKHHGAEYRKIKQEYLLYAGIDDEEDIPATTHTLL
jgi:hypothetical protein